MKICSKIIDVYGSALHGHELSENILKESPNNVEKTYTTYNKTMSDFWNRLLNLSEEEKKIYFEAVYQYRRVMGTD